MFPLILGISFTQELIQELLAALAIRALMECDTEQYRYYILQRIRKRSCVDYFSQTDGHSYHGHIKLANSISSSRVNRTGLCHALSETVSVLKLEYLNMGTKITLSLMNDYAYTRPFAWMDKR